MKELTVMDFRIGESVVVGGKQGVVSQLNEDEVRVFVSFVGKWRIHDYHKVAEVKKVLRRIEDMTEEEKREFRRIFNEYPEEISLCRPYEIEEIDYLDSIGIDQRGYIDAGLAVLMQRRCNVSKTQGFEVGEKVKVSYVHNIRDIKKFVGEIVLFKNKWNRVVVKNLENGEVEEISIMNIKKKEV